MNEFSGGGSNTELQTLGRAKVRHHYFSGIVLVVLCFVFAACTPTRYRKWADKEAYKILAQKAAEVPNVDPDISIEPDTRIVLKNLAKSNQRTDFLGVEGAQAEEGAEVLKLADCLELAIKHNRTYLTRKETLYLQALELTLARWEFAPLFSVNGAAKRGLEVTGGVERGIDAVIAQNSFNTRANAGMEMLQRTGARLAVDFSTDFLKFIGGNRSFNNSALAVTLAQPLLKGGGVLATTENLTQAEREMLYSLRDFANYRREFIVGIVADYYNVLRARDRALNTWVGYQGFVKSVQRETALAEEDRRTQTELGLLQQATLRNEGQWVNALRDYQQQLDEFKITLALPVESLVVLDVEELKKLELELPKLTRLQAVNVAIASRPDLITANDRRIDADRKIEVAKVDLRGGLDVVGGYELTGPTVDGNPIKTLSRNSWTAGLEVDLPMDRKAERNNYRAAIIALEQSRRNLDLAYDEVKLQIFDDWRSLAQAQQNFKISELGVKLAERRVEQQVLLAELGQGKARDQVDAQQDLTNSLNQRTSAIVDHTLARMGLWQDMGILFINKDGSWEKKLEAEANE